MLQNRNLWLTYCWAITESKQVISGHNVEGQESMTYPLLRHHRKQTDDQWTECCKTGIHDLPPIEAQKANRLSVDRMLKDMNPWLTPCWGISESKLVISGHNVAGHESMTYPLLRHHRKQTGDQWTECCRTGIHNLPTVKASQKANRWSVYLIVNPKQLLCIVEVSSLFTLCVWQPSFTTKFAYHDIISIWNRLGITPVPWCMFITAGIKHLDNHLVSAHILE